MPLTYTGRNARTETGMNFQAKDNDGRAVVVQASTEALEDYGEPAVRATGSKKYDARQYIGDDPRIVTVKTTDF